MNQSSESSTLLTPARRRGVPAVPVLIQIPALTSSRTVRGRVRRRRLRREVRVAGVALLALFPLSMAFVSFGGNRLSPLAASSLPVSPAGESLTTRQAPTISLSLEPVVTVQRDLDAPVFLPGYLLPADPPEESLDGGH